MLADEFAAEIIIGGASNRASAKSGFGPEELMRGGPRTKLATVAAAAAIVDQIHERETLTGEVSILEGCELSLKCAAPGRLL